MSEQYDYDVAVVGAGPAGYVAAIRAAQLGAHVCCIEKGPIGGCCTNVGCIPTKALWHAADVYHGMDRAAATGIVPAKGSVDYAAVAAHRDEVVQTLSGGVGALLKGNKVELVRGEAAFTDPHTLAVTADGEERTVSAEKIIIATGSQPIELPIAPFDHEAILSSSDAVTASELPESVIIVGGGYIGVEFANIYATFGVDVTVVEALDRLLPTIDEDCAREVVKALKKSGVKMHTGVALKSASVGDGAVTAVLADDTELAAERMLVCVGRRATCAGLAIENAGLELDDSGALPVNEHMQTARPHIYAAGDVVGGVMLAHVGSSEGVVAATHATGSLTAAMDYRVVPACAFARPEVATVGMSEQAAREAAGEITVKQFPFRALGKAYIMGQTDGFVKLIADAATGQLLGAHICGYGASLLLGEATLALQLECTAAELAETIHAHPTMPEAIKETADGLIGMPINWRG